MRFVYPWAGYHENYQACSTEWTIGLVKVSWMHCQNLLPSVRKVIKTHEQSIIASEGYLLVQPWLDCPVGKCRGRLDPSCTFQSWNPTLGQYQHLWIRCSRRHLVWPQQNSTALPYRSMIPPTTCKWPESTWRSQGILERPREWSFWRIAPFPTFSGSVSRHAASILARREMEFWLSWWRQ